MKAQSLTLISAAGLAVALLAQSNTDNVKTAPPNKSTSATSANKSTAAPKAAASKEAPGGGQTGATSGSAGSRPPVVPPAPPPPSPQQQADAIYREGMEKMIATPADLPIAAKAFHQALDLDPSYTPAQVALAAIADAAGDLDAALQGYQAARERIPLGPAKDLIQDAIKRLEQRRGLLVGQVQARQAIAHAEAQITANHWVPALTSLLEAAKADRGNWQSSALGAAVAAHLDKFGLAIQMLQKAAAAAPAGRQIALDVVRERLVQLGNQPSKTAPTTEELFFFKMLRGNTNFRTWAEFTKRYPNSVYLNQVNAGMQATFSLEDARYNEREKYRDAMETANVPYDCTATGVGRNETGNCDQILSYLGISDYGFCELKFGTDQNVHANKYNCDTSTSDDYRLSLTTIDPAAISSQGAFVTLRTLGGASTIIHTGLHGRQGIDCAGYNQPIQDKVSSVTMEYATAEAAEKARDSLRIVAAYCVRLAGGKK
jgi:tetratricopeptide (TPR) repeat protein